MEKRKKEVYADVGLIEKPYLWKKKMSFCADNPERCDCSDEENDKMEEKNETEKKWNEMNMKGRKKMCICEAVENPVNAWGIRHKKKKKTRLVLKTRRTSAQRIDS